MIVRNEEVNLPDCLRIGGGAVSTKSSWWTPARPTRPARRPGDLGPGCSSSPGWTASPPPATRACVTPAAAGSCGWTPTTASTTTTATGCGRCSPAWARNGTPTPSRSVPCWTPKRTAFRLLDQVRLFRNLPRIRWDYRIHEQILPAVNRAGATVRWTDVIVDHVGYQDAALRRRKLERNLRLLEMDHAERPDDSFSLFNLGWTLLDLGRTTDALPHLRRSLETAKPDSSILRKLHHLLAVAQRQLGSPRRRYRPAEMG